MKDNLEQLVRENKQAFDDKEPGKNVWKRISKELDGKGNYQWIWKAAAILFFLSSVGLATQVDFSADKQLAHNKEVINNDFDDIESFYFKMISEKRSLIYDFEENSMNIDQDFELDLQKLDAMYQVLKEELKTNPSKQVVDALILNLLVRVDILNEQLQELEVNSSDDDNQENQINA